MNRNNNKILQEMTISPKSDTFPFCMRTFDYSSFIKDVGIVNIFIFHTIWVGLNSNLNIRAFGHCINFSGKKVTTPKFEGAWVCTYDEENRSPKKEACPGSLQAMLECRSYEIEHGLFRELMVLHKFRYIILSRCKYILIVQYSIIICMF